MWKRDATINSSCEEHLTRFPEREVSSDVVYSHMISNDTVSGELVSTQVVSNHQISYCGIQEVSNKQIIVKSSKPRSNRSSFSKPRQLTSLQWMIKLMLGLLCCQFDEFISCPDVKPAISAFSSKVKTLPNSPLRFRSIIQSKIMPPWWGWSEVTDHDWMDS